MSERSLFFTCLKLDCILHNTSEQDELMGDSSLYVWIPTVDK